MIIVNTEKHVADLVLYNSEGMKDYIVQMKLKKCIMLILSVAVDFEYFGRWGPQNYLTGSYIYLTV